MTSNTKPRTMRRLFSRTRFIAPFLFSERGSVQLTRALRSAGGGPAQFGEDLQQYNLQLEGKHEGCDLSSKLLSDCSSKQVVLNDLNLESATWRRSMLRAASIHRASAAESRWEVIDLDNAELAESDFQRSQFNLVSLRDATIGNVNLTDARFVLCDFSGARFADVDFSGAHFVGCDFEGAVFEKSVDFSGADLTGSHLQRAWIGGASFDGARLQDCDMRGALGVADGADLVRAGASYRPSLLGRLFEKLLGSDAAQHRRVLTATSVTWALLALLLPALFFARAIRNPVNPDQIPLVEETGEEADGDHQND